MRTGSFQTDTERASKQLKKFEKAVDETAKKIALGFVAAQTALTALVLKTTQSAEEINRFAQISGASAESFQRFAAGAETVGISQEKLADQFKDFREKVGEFLQTGGGGMKDFFEQIAPKVGVTAEQFRKLSGPEALQLYVDSLQKAGLSQEQMSFYLESMASDTTALIPLLQNGGKAMQEFGDRADATGRVISDNLIKQSMEFQKNLRELTGLLQGFANNIVGAVLPSLLRFADELIAGTQATNGLIDAIRVLSFAKPFDDAGKGAKYYRDELDRLKTARDKLIQQEGVLANTSGFDRDIELAQKRLAYFNALQLRQVNRGITSSDQTGAEARRLGLTGPSMPVPISVPSSARKGGGAVDAAKKEAEAYDDWMQQMREGELERYVRMLDQQDAALKKSIEDQKKEEEAYQDWMREMQMAEHDRYYDMLAQREDATKKAQDLAKELGLTFTSAFEDAIVEGKKLSDVLRGLAQDILRIATRKLVTEPLGNLLTSAIGGMFGGAKAGGGDVIGGRSYLVGENGPEMFTPRTTGTITPNGSMSQNITVNVNMQDGSVSAQNASILGSFVAGAVKQELIKQKRAGGLLA